MLIHGSVLNYRFPAIYTSIKSVFIARVKLWKVITSYRTIYTRGCPQISAVKSITSSVTRQKGISAVMPFLKFFALKTLLTKVYHHTKYDKDLMKVKEI